MTTRSTLVGVVYRESRIGKKIANSSIVLKLISINQFLESETDKLDLYRNWIVYREGTYKRGLRGCRGVIDQK